MRLSRTLFTALSLFALTSASLRAQDINPDTIHAGRFDSGKMWTFEYPPTQFFSQTYGFTADAQWFEHARMAALRIPGCSASFVSPNGLIVTNHHCARGGVVQVTKPGEDLLENGFVANSLAEERPVKGFYADQLISVQDVSSEVFAALDKATTEADRAATRMNTFAAIQQRLKAPYSGDSIVVQIVPLYAGGRYSAYVFRRYTDVRLVAAAELQAGFFGGDFDNFTYPRYDLDFSFLRVYGKDGKPLASPTYFKWSKAGVQQNDVVFVIGNPGPTTRMNAVAQLEFIRDVQLPVQIGALQKRWDALNAQLQAAAPGTNVDQIRNQMFGISNTLKAGQGRLDALHDAVVMAKRRDAERQFAAALAAKPELQAKYGGVLPHLADIQQRKRQYVAAHGLPAANDTASEWQSLLNEEREWNSQLGRARFEIYGTDMPPDATFSLRITDGVVIPYEYNGTIAPVYTTFFGMYDRYYGFGRGQGAQKDWDLPKRWVPTPKDLDLGTPLNFISTADTYGGNSGSPAVTKNLEIVGLNFDRNVNGLSRDYVYLPERGRNIMVDVRAIAESLNHVYNAPRVLTEIMTGKLTN